MAIDPTIGKKSSLPKTFLLLFELFSKIAQKIQYPIFGHLQLLDEVIENLTTKCFWAMLKKRF
jgi:hypothetical protein